MIIESRESKVFSIVVVLEELDHSCFKSGSETLHSAEQREAYGSGYLVYLIELSLLSIRNENCSGKRFFFEVSSLLKLLAFFVFVLEDLLLLINFDF